MSNSFQFTTRVWLTSIVSAPALLVTIDSFSLGMTIKEFLIGRLYFILFAIVFGIIFSLPSWTILFLTTKFINRRQLSILQKKLLLLPVAALLTVAPFYILFSADDWNTQKETSLKFGAYYLATILGGILLYKLRPDSNSRQVHYS